MIKQRPTLAELGISSIYPPGLRRALIDAENWPATERLQRIDALTLEAVRLGLARRPDDTSLHPLSSAQRAAAAARPATRRGAA